MLSCVCVWFVGGEERNEGTGGTVWDCALVMSKYFEKLSETQNWSNKTVLEGTKIKHCF
jgi:hypothetical protein